MAIQQVVPYLDLVAIGRLTKAPVPGLRSDRGLNGEMSVTYTGGRTVFEVYHSDAAAWTQFVGEADIDHGSIAGLTDDDHGQYLKEKASGGAASEIPAHTHASAGEAGTIAHSALTGVSTSQHHSKYTDAEAVTALSGHTGSASAHHSKYTDAEAVTALSGHTGSANAHHNEAHTVASHSDTSATGSELNTLTDGSNADSLHSHAGGWVVELTDAAEYSTTALSDTLIKSYTVSIPVTAHVRFRYSAYVANGNTANGAGTTKIYINGVALGASMGMSAEGTTGGPTNANGQHIVEFGPRGTNYRTPGFSNTVIGRTDLSSQSSGQTVLTGSNLIPNATITTIEIYGINALSSMETFIKDMLIEVLDP